MNKIKCNNCGWMGKEEDLEFIEDKSFPENSREVCPQCTDDKFLVDIN